MDKREIEELREKVGCAALLEKDGWKVDVKESTRRAIKFRRDSNIIIVIHEGRGWFDPLSPAKGDVFLLAEHLGAERDGAVGVVQPQRPGIRQAALSFRSRLRRLRNKKDRGPRRQQQRECPAHDPQHKVANRPADSFAGGRFTRPEAQRGKRV